MVEFEYALGQTVTIDPTGEGNAPKGLVTGHITYLNGSIGYFVSCREGYGNVGEVRRHILDACEIRASLAAKDAKL